MKYQLHRCSTDAILPISELESGHLRQQQAGPYWTRSNCKGYKKNYFPAAICPFQLLKLIAPLIFCNKLFFLLFLYSTYENPRFSQVLLNPGLDGRVLALI